MRHWRLLWFPLVIMCDLVESVFFMAMLSRFGVGSPHISKQSSPSAFLNIPPESGGHRRMPKTRCLVRLGSDAYLYILKFCNLHIEVFGLPVLLAGHDALNSLNLHAL